eukprot:6249488-Amphidinium_carterae.1
MAGSNLRDPVCVAAETGHLGRSWSHFSPWFACHSISTYPEHTATCAGLASEDFIVAPTLQKLKNKTVVD